MFGSVSCWCPINSNYSSFCCLLANSANFFLQFAVNIVVVRRRRVQFLLVRCVNFQFYELFSITIRSLFRFSWRMTVIHAICVGYLHVWFDQKVVVQSEYFSKIDDKIGLFGSLDGIIENFRDYFCLSGSIFSQCHVEFVVTL